MKFTLKNPFLFFIFIGIQVAIINSFAATKAENSTKAKANRDIASEIKLEPTQHEFVEVESLNVMTDRTSGEYRLVPYKFRRAPWGGSVNVGYSFYNPVNYEPDFQASSLGFETVYGESANSPLIEVTFTYKRNYSFFSIGSELSIGTFSTSATSNVTSDDVLSLIPIRLGLILELDAFMTEPYVAPYFTGGGYIMRFSETQAASVFEGNTTVAPYWGAGLKMQINWVESTTARVAYEENGMENTFIFLEARQYLKSSAEQDKNFKTKPFLTTGLSLEF